MQHNPRPIGKFSATNLRKMKLISSDKSKKAEESKSKAVKKSSEKGAMSRKALLIEALNQFRTSFDVIFGGIKKPSRISSTVDGLVV